MKQIRLDAEALDVASFETAAVAGLPTNPIIVTATAITRALCESYDPCY